MRLTLCPARFSNLGPCFVFHALFLAACLLPLRGGAETITLREAAAQANLNIGIATSGAEVSGSDEKYKSIVSREFNILVAENDLKFQDTEPSRGEFSFTKGDQIVEFAQAHDMKLRGHTMVWHAQSGWAAGANAGREGMLEIMKDHIEGVLGHYKGQFLEWDIVNEAMENGEAGDLRHNFWYNNIGDDYLDSAFVYAHQVDSSLRLYYNDYSAEGINTKSNAIYDMVKRMKEDGIPIHGVGLQSHFGTVNKEEISANIKRLGSSCRQILLRRYILKR